MTIKNPGKRLRLPSQPEEIRGESLSKQDRFWLDNARDLLSSSIPSIEEASKQIIGLVTLLQGILFAALSIGDLKATLIRLKGGNGFWCLIALIIIPISCWLASLWFSILVFKPESYLINLNSPDLSREMFLTIVQYKKRRLMQAYTALASGFTPLIVAILVYFLS